MNNNLTALNNYLFEALERLTDDSLSDEQLEKEINRSKAISDVAGQVLHTGELSIKAMQVRQEFGIGSQEKLETPTMPALLDE